MECLSTFYTFDDSIICQVLTVFVIPPTFRAFGDINELRMFWPWLVNYICPTQYNFIQIRYTWNIWSVNLRKWYNNFIDKIVFFNTVLDKCSFMSGDMCYGTLWTLTFFFFFYLFSLILYFFSFEFLFIFLFSDDEEARDITVTWHVTWCDIISLEHSGKI